MAAFFTQPSFRLRGPVTRTELKRSVVCSPQQASAVLIAPEVSSVLMPPVPVMASGLTNAMAWCSSQLAEGNVAAVAADESVLGEFMALRGGCDNMSHVSTLDTVPTAVGFSFSTASSALPPDFGLQVSKAVAFMVRSSWYQQRAEELLYKDFRCPGEGPDNSAGETAAVTFRQMSGLFLICGIFALIALILGIGNAVQGGFRRFMPRMSLRRMSQQDTTSQAEVLAVLLRKMEEVQAAVCVPVANGGGGGRKYSRRPTVPATHHMEIGQRVQPRELDGVLGEQRSPPVRVEVDRVDVEVEAVSSTVDAAAERKRELKATTFADRTDRRPVASIVPEVPGGWI
mmetsp:Transcript_59616/g.177111  ORF Transcript_59616/g.177111 Transcript_59616/m.177111 type:complete len:343 (-) Transcript_59616:93-1121(-)